jgi:hypothetical protein
VINQWSSCLIVETPDQTIPVLWMCWDVHFRSKCWGTNPWATKCFLRGCFFYSIADSVNFLFVIPLPAIKVVAMACLRQLVCNTAPIVYGHGNTVKCCCHRSCWLLVELAMNMVRKYCIRCFPNPGYH